MTAGVAGSHMSPLAESPTANSSAASSPHKAPQSHAYVPLPGAPPLAQQQPSMAGIRQDSARMGTGLNINSLPAEQPAVGVQTNVSPFAAQSHHATFDPDPQVRRLLSVYSPASHASGCVC